MVTYRLPVFVKIILFDTLALSITQGVTDLLYISLTRSYTPWYARPEYHTQLSFDNDILGFIIPGRRFFNLTNKKYP